LLDTHEGLTTPAPVVPAPAPVVPALTPEQMLAKLEKGEYQSASKLPDSSFKVSGEHAPDHGVSHSRLNYAGPNPQAWLAAMSDGAWIEASLGKPFGVWIEVNLGKPSQVFGVLTQGRGDYGDTTWDYGNWTTGFALLGSLDGKDFQKIGDFVGNTERNSVKRNILMAPVTYQFIRLVVTTFQTHPALRWEVLYE